jgi:hypothetical protein
MSTFMIPGSAFEGVTALGTAPPAAGYYEVSLVEIENKSSDKFGSRRFHIQLPNGFKMFDFVHLPWDMDNNGNSVQVPGLSEKQVRGRTAALITILQSLGYSYQEITSAQGIHDDWFLTSKTNRKGYVEFIPGQRGVQGSYSTIKSWLTKEAYETLKNSDAKPTVSNNHQAAAAPKAPANAGSLAMPPAAATMAPAPTNGAGAPQVGAALPPPPSAAQQIVS